MAKQGKATQSTTPITSAPESKGVWTPGGQFITPDDFAGELQITVPYFKVSVGGGPGSGKSRTSAEIARGAYLLLRERKLMAVEKPLLIIDTEEASQFLVEFFADAGIPARAKKTRSLADVQTAFMLAAAGHYFGVYIDSITHIYKDFLDAWIKKVNYGKEMQMRDYGKTNAMWDKEFGQAFVNAKTNIFFTGRGVADYEMTENERDGKTVKSMEKVGVKMQGNKDTPFDPNLTVWMDVAQRIGAKGAKSIWRTAFIMKDRTTLIDGMTLGNEKMKGPRFEDFKPHFDFLLRNVKPGAAATIGTTTAAGELIPEPHEQDPNVKRKAIALDGIKAELVSAVPGRSDAETKLKNDILFNAFGVRGWKEIETLDADTLTQGLESVREQAAAINAAKEAAKVGA